MNSSRICEAFSFFFCLQYEMKPPALTYKTFANIDWVAKLRGSDQDPFFSGKVIKTSNISFVAFNAQSL